MYMPRPVLGTDYFLVVLVVVCGMILPESNFEHLITLQESMYKNGCIGELSMNIWDDSFRSKGFCR